MAGLTLCAVVAAISSIGAGETVLLDFSANWCGPCQQMKPTVHQLEAAGHPVRVVDIDQQPQLAAQYRVSGIPCFVMVVNGQEVGRIEGRTTYGQLERLLSLAPPAAPNAPAPIPDLPPAAVPDLTPPPAATQVHPTAPPRTTQNNYDPAEAQRRAMAASVRLKVIDSAGNSFGTGTIVDIHEQEALVLTCGHIFRDSQGRGEITVDLFLPTGIHTVQGLLISYDLTRDIALVVIRPGIPVEAVQIAAEPSILQPERRIFSIGCDRGGLPSIRESRITTVDRYMGPANVEIAGQPVVGRSGGGLFTTDGRLIGVCNAADPSSDEGIYASLPTIQAELDDNRLSYVYASPSSPAASLASSPSPAPIDSSATMAAITPPPSATQATVPVHNQPLSSQASQTSPPFASTAPLNDRVTPALFNEVTNQTDDLEVICIVQSRSNSSGRSEVIRLQDPSHAFLDQLSQEYRTQLGHQSTQLRSPPPAQQACEIEALRRKLSVIPLRRQPVAP